MNNKTMLNTVSSIMLEIIVIINSFIVPKIILNYFGSEVNGLVSSLTQLLNYISLIEGGVTGVVMANLYKPLVNKDFEKVSSIINTTEKFYKKISAIFIVYTLCIGLIYPCIISTQFSYGYIFSLTLILALTFFIQYNFSLTNRSLLIADKKGYIVSISRIIIMIINIVLAYISVKIYPSIHLLKLVNGLLYIIQPVIFKYFVNKNFNINKSAPIDKKKIKSRWDGFAINIAAFIHFSTDVVVLTLFTNLSTVSIYTIYSSITGGLRGLVTSITSAINPVIGQLYAKEDYETLKKYFDEYEFMIFFIVFLIFSVSILLITPFVVIYTKGINDINYNQTLFGVLLVISEELYLLKMPYLDLALVANRFKQMRLPSYLEAIINIVLSVVLVKKYGLIGVASGTIVAMLFRMIYQVAYLKKHIIYRDVKIFVKKISIFTIFSIIGLGICKFLVGMKIYSILSWIIYGIIYSLVFFILYCILGIVFYRNTFKMFIKILFNGIRSLLIKLKG